MFGARANQEIWVGDTRIVEIGAEGLLIDLRGIDLAVQGGGKQTARRVFEESTRAVGWTLSWYLRDASEHLADYDRASASFDTARLVWASFEYEIRATDPETYRDLGGRWLACASALGSPGVLGVGIALPDTEVFESESARILDYIAVNFGPEYAFEGSGRLAPLPTMSPTFGSGSLYLTLVKLNS